MAAWSLRSDAPDAVISHGDVGPWHVIQRQDRPVGFIDWSLAGPTDRLEELAASGWWNTQLGFGDDLDQDNGPPEAASRRGRQLRLFLDGYGLATAERPGLVTRMIEFAVGGCAGLAKVKQITPDSNAFRSVQQGDHRAREEFAPASSHGSLGAYS